MKSKRMESTFDKSMKNAKFRKAFEKEYEKLEISEMLCELMEKEEVSVRSLAAKADVAPSTVQNLRDGTVKNANLSSLRNILRELGCKLIVRKKRKEYVLT